MPYVPCRLATKKPRPRTSLSRGLHSWHCTTGPLARKLRRVLGIRRLHDQSRDAGAAPSVRSATVRLLPVYSGCFLGSSTTISTLQTQRLPRRLRAGACTPPLGMKGLLCGRHSACRVFAGQDDVPRSTISRSCPGQFCRLSQAVNPSLSHHLQLMSEVGETNGPRLRHCGDILSPAPQVSLQIDPRRGG